MSNDNIKKIFLVATSLCVVCAVVVSSAAVILKPLQEKNKALDVKKNILKAAGLMKDGEKVDIDGLFDNNIEGKIVDLATGEYVDQPVKGFDQRKRAKNPDQSIEIESSKDIAGIKRRSKLATVYLVKNEDSSLDRVVIPVHGKGLWSTLYGFIAVDKDLRTIKSLAFYEHAETPGLGGEVDNPLWKAKWNGKQIFDENNEVKISVLKGSVDPASKDASYQVDGLSGATITARGVSNLIRFWLGESGFGPYLARLNAS